MTHRTRQRIGTVVLAPAAALAAWALTQLVGIDLVVSTGDGRVGPTDVIGAAALSALVAWVVVRALERRSRQPQRLWATIASTLLAVSLVGPTWCADGASALALIAAARRARDAELSSRSSSRRRLPARDRAQPRGCQRDRSSTHRTAAAGR